MTERERLIELLAKASGKYMFVDKYNEAVADYLLENGVIVLPCKVGDTVYETDGIRIYELIILDISLHENKPYYETESLDFDDDAIGKSIFLTRKEAEKALEVSK